MMSVSHMCRLAIFKCDSRVCMSYVALKCVAKSTFATVDMFYG